MLCQFAHHFPEFVAQFLGQGRKLQRRFREETITDLLMGSLMMVGGANVIVEFPDETSTGADMEWNFVNRDDGTFFRILLQAKQAYGDGGIWRRHCYRELLHTSGSGTTRQAVILCNAARTGYATYPLYLFYHPEHTCSLATNDGCSSVSGVNVADGFAIERLVAASSTRALRTSNKSVGRIEPLLTPLSSLFCPEAVVPLDPQAIDFVPGATGNSQITKTPGRLPRLWQSMPPTPTEIRKRLLSLPSWLSEENELAIANSQPIPDVSREIPLEVKRVIDGRRQYDKALHWRRGWRVTFVSGTAPNFDS
jgi:hypothetical protein